MINKKYRRTRMVLRAAPCVVIVCVLSMLLSRLIVTVLAIDSTHWSFITGVITGLITGRLVGRLTADWVIAPLFEEPHR